MFWGEGESGAGEKGNVRGCWDGEWGEERNGKKGESMENKYNDSKFCLY